MKKLEEDPKSNVGHKIAMQPGPAEVLKPSRQLALVHNKTPTGAGLQTFPVSLIHKRLESWSSKEEPTGVSWGKSLFRLASPGIWRQTRQDPNHAKPKVNIIYSKVSDHVGCLSQKRGGFDYSVTCVWSLRKETSQ